MRLFDWTKIGGKRTRLRGQKPRLLRRNAVLDVGLEKNEPTAGDEYTAASPRKREIR